MNPVKFLQKLWVWLPDRVRTLVALDTILLLRRKISSVPDHEEFSLEIYGRYDPVIMEIYRSAGREISEQRVRARFNHGLKLYLLTRSNDTVAWTWLIPPGRRFIDETGYHFPVPEKATWIRDIFVDPRYRGRKMFSALLDVLFNRVLNADREIWSDTEARNHSSVRAHLNSGFAVVDSLKVLRLNKCLMIRLRRPEQVKYVDGFKPNNKVVITLKAYRAYKHLHLA